MLLVLPEKGKLKITGFKTDLKIYSSKLANGKLGLLQE